MSQRARQPTDHLGWLQDGVTRNMTRNPQTR